MLIADSDLVLPVGLAAVSKRCGQERQVLASHVACR